MITSTIILIAQVITALGVIGGAVWYLWKKISPLINRVLKSLDDIDEIKLQFLPNGGSSLKDSVNRLETNILEVKDDISILSTDASRSDARQWAIVATLRDPIWESDADGLYIRGNSTLLDLVERTNDEISGNGWENIIHRDDKAMVAQEWANAISKRRNFELSFRIFGKSSHALYQVRAVCMPYYSQQKELLGFIGRYVNVKRLNEKYDLDNLN